MKPKKKNTVITIDSALHEEFRRYCEQNGVKIGFLAAQAPATKGQAGQAPATKGQAGQAPAAGSKGQAGQAPAAGRRRVPARRPPPPAPPRQICVKKYFLLRYEIE